MSNTIYSDAFNDIKLPSFYYSFPFDVYSIIEKTMTYIDIKLKSNSSVWDFILQDTNKILE